MLHIKILLAYYTEIIHRKVYDEIFIPNGEPFTKKQLITLRYFDFLYFLNPKYRRILKHYKEVFVRAYKRHKLSPMYFYLFLLMKNKNYKRYN